MGFILAIPSAPPTPGPVIDWSGLRVVWTGWDGSEWVLSDPRSGVQLGQGNRGMAMPEPIRYTTVSPAIAGSRYRGSSYAEREVFWPLAVFCDMGSQAWLDYDRAFWATLHPERPGILSVTQPNGTTRSLTCRFVSDGGKSFESDPSRDGWAAYEVTLVAEDPWWYGEPVERTWVAGAGSPFFGGVTGGFGPPFVISAGNTLAKASIPNPGDVEAYPVWTIQGPTTAVAVGLNGHTTSYNATIAEGASITIDTHPDRETVTDQAGVDRLSGLVLADFAAVPSGAEVPLTLTMTGTGTVTASLRPGHLRAW